jgi:hypothetical protein
MVNLVKFDLGTTRWDGYIWNGLWVAAVGGAVTTGTTGGCWAQSAVPYKTKSGPGLDARRKIHAANLFQGE